MSEHNAHAQAFLDLHQPGKPFVLPNAWDALSARLAQEAGFDAVATTSAGLSWALGYGDGEHAPFAEVLGVVRRMVASLRVPLTVDFETGYADTDTGFVHHTAALLDAGVVGVNLEDGLRGHGPQRPLREAAARVARVRKVAEQAGIHLVINARVDTWIGATEPRDHAVFSDAVARAHAYLSEGADVIFPIGLSEPSILTAFTEQVAAPVNAIADASVAELAACGVARISTASRLTSDTYGHLSQTLTHIHEHGDFRAISTAFGYGAIQALWV